MATSSVDGCPRGSLQPQGFQCVNDEMMHDKRQGKGQWEPDQSDPEMSLEKLKDWSFRTGLHLSSTDRAHRMASGQLGITTFVLTWQTEDSATTLTTRPAKTMARRRLMEIIASFKKPTKPKTEVQGRIDRKASRGGHRAY